MKPIDLSEFIATKAEANDFLSRITAVSEKIFQSDFNLHKALTEQFGVTKSDRFLSMLLNNNINAESLPEVKAFLNMLQKQISSLQVLSLTIAFEPNQQMLTSLSEWFLVNMKKQMLFDITVDRTVVAGAIISYKGKFSDFSIRPTFQRILQNATTESPTPAIVPQKVEPSEQTTHQSSDDISLGR